MPTSSAATEIMYRGRSSAAIRPPFLRVEPDARGEGDERQYCEDAVEPVAAGREEEQLDADEERRENEHEPGAPARRRRARNVRDVLDQLAAAEQHLARIRHARPRAPFLGRLRLRHATRILEVTAHEKSLSRGFSRDAFFSSSSASRSFFVSFFGTLTRTRASRSPLPEPLSFGAPRPRIRRSLPSCEPAGTFRETAPSGVGTSTLAPRAASG